MGRVCYFAISKLTEHFGLRYFVETGTGQGESLAEVVDNYFFRAYFSCDWDEIMVRGSRHRMREHLYVHIMHARSTDFLEGLLAELPHKDPIMFWLDAHFPGTAERDDALRLPLAEELNIIARRRPQGHDVIAIDDLSIYEEGPFTLRLDERLREWVPKQRGIGFVHEALGRTHYINRYYADGGYVLATPKVLLR